VRQWHVRLEFNGADFLWRVVVVHVVSIASETGNSVPGPAIRWSGPIMRPSRRP
jgi:hypothetical protein